MSFPRYPEYKDSGVDWLGLVPMHWKVVQLKRFLDIQNGADHKPIEVEEGHPVYGSGGVFAFASDYIHDGESILLGRKGTIDKPLYVCGRFWTVDTMYWSKINPEAVGKFLYYACTTIPFNYYSTNTALPSMTKGDLSAHLIGAPPTEEQGSIANFLDHETAKIDALIAEQEKLIELLKEKRQAVISHAVTKGLDPNVKMKDSGVEWLGQVPEHWLIKTLKKISPSISVGIVVNPSHYVSEKGVPFIYGGDVSEGRINWQDARKISVEHSRLNAKTLLSIDDLITVRVGAPGITAVVPKECEGGNCASVMLIKKGDFNSNWLCFLMNTQHVRFQIEVVKYGAAQEQFNISHAINFLIPMPPREEQDLMVEYLKVETRKIDNLIEEVSVASELLQERRSALISAAVTGQIDVRSFVPETEPA